MPSESFRSGGIALSLYEQDVFSGDGSVFYVELLSRICDEDGSCLPIGDFFDNIHYGDLERIALAQLDTLAFTRTGKRYGINLPPALLDSEAFVVSYALMDHIANGRIRPGELVIEITEHAPASSRRESIRRSIGRLHEAGVRFAVDDFGSGGSNFDTLRELDGLVDFVKIDGPFFQHSLDDEGCKKMLYAFVMAVRSKGIEVVLEHIESEEQHAIAKECGGSGFQGFFLSTPSACMEFEPIDVSFDAPLTATNV